MSVNFVLIYFRTTTPFFTANQLSHYQSLCLSLTAIQLYVGTVLLVSSENGDNWRCLGASVPQETGGHPLGEKEDPVKGEQQPVDPGHGPRKNSRSRLGQRGGKRQLKDPQVAWALGNSWLLSHHEITTCRGNGKDRKREWERNGKWVKENPEREGRLVVWLYAEMGL